MGYYCAVHRINHSGEHFDECAEDKKARASVMADKVPLTWGVGGMVIGTAEVFSDGTAKLDIDPEYTVQFSTDMSGLSIYVKDPFDGESNPRHARQQE